MKILYLHQYFMTPTMSGGTRSFEMARRWVEHGHEVHMITSDRRPGVRGRRWYETMESGIRVHWLPVVYSNRMSFMERLRGFSEFAALAAPRAISIGGDVVFATSTPLTIAIPAMATARSLSIPWVFEVRDLWPEAPIAIGALKNPLAIAGARRLEKMAYRSAKHIVALSPGMKAGVVATGCSPDKVTMIPNACDFDQFGGGAEAARSFRASQPWLGDRPLVVYTGTLGQVNGVEYLVKLAAAVSKVDPEIRFLVVGEGREESLIRESAERLKVLGKNFHMMPPVPKQALIGILGAAQLSAMLVIGVPPLWNCSPNKFFDSLAAGVPVLVNHGGWLADLVRETESGLVVDPADMEGAAMSVVSAIRNPAWGTRAGTAAKKLGVERFARDDLASQLEQILVKAQESAR